jgi:hypothetical protein
MADEPILNRFNRLNVWSRNGQRGPGKLMLVSYALGRWSCGNLLNIGFRETDRDLTPPRLEFNLPRRSRKTDEAAFGVAVA